MKQVNINILNNVYGFSDKQGVVSYGDNLEMYSGYQYQTVTHYEGLIYFLESTFIAGNRFYLLVIDYVNFALVHSSVPTNVSLGGNGFSNIFFTSTSSILTGIYISQP